MLQKTELKTRFTTGRILAGTRRFHHFIPINKCKIPFKKISQQTDIQIFNIVQIPNEFVVCKVVYNHGLCSLQISFFGRYLLGTIK